MPKKKGYKVQEKYFSSDSSISGSKKTPYKSDISNLGFSPSIVAILKRNDEEISTSSDSDRSLMNSKPSGLTPHKKERQIFQYSSRITDEEIQNFGYSSSDNEQSLLGKKMVGIKRELKESESERKIRIKEEIKTKEVRRSKRKMKTLVRKKEQNTIHKYCYKKK